jgi:hydroxymethylbilane synthase
MKVVIGTRGSALALWQARHVASLVESLNPGTEVDLEIIKTKGDKILDTPLALIGGKGLFTKEIEDALLDGRVDLAVHSMKDLPTELPEGLNIGAVLVREDPRDVFISADFKTLEELPFGAKIGTSSLRRIAFLMSRFPGVKTVPIRGNVDTRLRKIESEQLDGILLASAGIKRMGFGERVTQHLDPELMVPAIGQGALGIEARIGDARIDELLAPLMHFQTRSCVAAERAFLRRMGGGCQVPMGAHAVIRDNMLHIVAAVAHPSGTPVYRHTMEVDACDTAVGFRIADELISRGAMQVAKEVLGDDWEPGPAQAWQPSEQA